MGVYDDKSRKVTWYTTFTARKVTPKKTCYLYKEAQQCPSMDETPACPANVSGITLASIAWKNSVPSLCGEGTPDLGPCDAIRIGPSDMDNLAKMAAGDPGCSGAAESLQLINKINNRYIDGVLVTGDPSNQNKLCPAYDGQAVGPMWKTIKDGSSGGGKDITEPSDVGMYSAEIRDGSGNVTKNFEAVTTTSGCGWWGRGVIQTSGPCNFGKLNNALKNVSLYTDPATGGPLFSLCRTPEVLCNTAQFGELKWVSGMFYWSNNVQNYETSDDDKHNFPGWKGLEEAINDFLGKVKDNAGSGESLTGALLDGIRKSGVATAGRTTNEQYKSKSVINPNQKPFERQCDDICGEDNCTKATAGDPANACKWIDDWPSDGKATCHPRNNGPPGCVWTSSSNPTDYGWAPTRSDPSLNDLSLTLARIANRCTNLVNRGCPSEIVGDPNPTGIDRGLTACPAGPPGPQGTGFVRQDRTFKALQMFARRATDISDVDLSLNAMINGMFGDVDSSSYEWKQSDLPWGLSGCPAGSYAQCFPPSADASGWCSAQKYDFYTYVARPMSTQVFDPKCTPDTTYDLEGFRVGMEVSQSFQPSGWVLAPTDVPTAPASLRGMNQNDYQKAYAIVNISLFLGQGGAETLQYAACDENNWTGGLPSALYAAQLLCAGASGATACDTDPGYSQCKWDANNNECVQNIFQAAGSGGTAGRSHGIAAAAAVAVAVAVAVGM